MQGSKNYSYGGYVAWSMNATYSVDIATTQFVPHPLPVCLFIPDSKCLCIIPEGTMQLYESVFNEWDICMSV